MNLLFSENLLILKASVEVRAWNELRGFLEAPIYRYYSKFDRIKFFILVKKFERNDDDQELELKLKFSRSWYLK